MHGTREEKSTERYVLLWSRDDIEPVVIRETVSFSGYNLTIRTKIKYESKRG